MCNKKDISVIPKGMYCYTRETEGIVVCPYWSMDKSRPKQENGHCSYMEKGDWDINYEAEVTLECFEEGKLVRTEEYRKGHPPFPVGLLWDMCKECGINYEDDE